MIQLAKDLFITSNNLPKTPKEVKNRDYGEEFATVLREEDSRVAKSNPVVNEKPVSMDKQTREQKISNNRESLLIDRVEGSIPFAENLFEKDIENETGSKSDDYLNVSLHMSVPFIAEEKDKIDADLNNDLSNCQENEISDVHAFKDASIFGKYSAQQRSDESHIRNASDFSSLCDAEAAKELDFADGNLTLRFDADNAEIADKMVFLSVGEENVSTGVDYNRSLNLGLNNDGNVDLSTYVNENIIDSLLDNESDNLNTDKFNETNNTGNADFTSKIGKESWRQNLKISSKLGESVSKLSADEVQSEAREEISEPVNALETEKEYAVNIQNDEDNDKNHVLNGMEHKNHSDNQYKKDIDKEKISANNDLDASNDINKEMLVNRPEFLSFMHKISEQNSLSSADPSKNILKSQQMNLLNKGRFAFSEGVENVVRFIRTENLAKAVLIVDPPALGRVNIELISTDNGIEAILRVSNEQIKMLVQEESAQLKRDLEQIGVTLTEFSVDVQNDGNRSRNQSFNNHRSRRMAHLGSAEGENEDERVEIFRVDLRKGLLHWIA